MQAKMSYTKIGIFSLASYPYRCKDKGTALMLSILACHTSQHGLHVCAPAAA